MSWRKQRNNKNRKAQFQCTSLEPDLEKKWKLKWRAENPSLVEKHLSRPRSSRPTSTKPRQRNWVVRDWILRLKLQCLCCIANYEWGLWRLKWLCNSIMSCSHASGLSSLVGQVNPRILVPITKYRWQRVRRHKCLVLETTAVQLSFDGTKSFTDFRPIGMNKCEC